MKTNLPVSSIERNLLKDRYLVSKTDAKGIITYANDVFVEASGFSREELIGKNHNIVRHPDMPAAAFANMWETLQEGLPWRGAVKNRCKNGDFYWVNAFAAPIYQGTAIVGYISVRTPASRAEVQGAESLYQQIREGASKLSTKPVLWKRMANISIKARLVMLMASMFVLVAGLSAISVAGLGASNAALEKAYHQGLEPIEMIGEITNLMNDNRGLIMLALQHSPTNAFSAMHEQPLEAQMDRVIKNQAQIAALIARLQSSNLTPELKVLLEKYVAARDVFVKEGLNVARDALLADDFDRANYVLLGKITPAYAKAESAANAFREAVKQQSKAEYATAQVRYSQIANLAIGAVVLALLFVVLCGFWVIRSITKPVNDAIEKCSRIAQGDLTGDIDIGGRHEIGRLMAHLAMMQAHLKSMLDEIKATSKQIDVEAALINGHVQSVYAQSSQQRDSSNSVASATEEFSQSVHEVADSARNAAAAASNAQEKVSAARTSMTASVTTTNHVVDSVRKSSKAISDLEQVISKVGTVTLAIKEIADQTNLLALNAAIEAARAGAEGRGFAVVADEVRKLAERTARATSEITGMVDEIHRVTESSVASINQVVSEVEENADQITHRIEELEQIGAASQKITDMSAHIAEAAQEQAAASEQVAQNMEQIAALVEGNVDYVTKAMTSADSITQRAASLRELCHGFKV